MKTVAVEMKINVQSGETEDKEAKIYDRILLSHKKKLCHFQRYRWA